MRRLATLSLLIVLVAACARHTPPELQFVSRPQPGPFSPVVRVGDLLFLSGQIGTDSTGRLAPGGILEETRQTMQNIRAVVEQNGSSMERVVKCTVFLADMSEWGAMNQVYSTFFPGPKPARSAMGANGLALNARVEIECTAVVR